MTEFPAYHHFHTEGTGLVVAVPMLLELGLSILLIINKNDLLPLSINLILLLLVIFIWIITFFFAIPLHEQLAQNGYDQQAIRKLTQVNWYRTASWTLRFIILTWFVIQWIDQK